MILELEFKDMYRGLFIQASLDKCDKNAVKMRIFDIGGDSLKRFESHAKNKVDDMNEIKKLNLRETSICELLKDGIRLRGISRI